jgi:protein dithiol oxidoreductase (disulfide-forming)
MKLKLVIASVAFLTSVILFAADNLVQGSYESIQPHPTATGNKIEVLEFFWYGCPHCYTLEPYLEKWQSTKTDDVQFRRVPAILGKNWIPHAKAYFTAEKLGVVDKIHRPLFDAIHKDQKKIIDEKTLRDFFADKGVDKDEFTRIYESSEISEKIQESFILGQQYQITGVPAIIVNGKYRTSASMAGSNANLIEVINQLTAIERQSASK